jgi:hypothetical protein
MLRSSSIGPAACCSQAMPPGSGRKGHVHAGPKMVAEDREAELISISRLAGLTFEAAVFGHGRAISRDAAERFREFAARG